MLLIEGPDRLIAVLTNSEKVERALDVAPEGSVSAAEVSCHIPEPDSVAFDDVVDVELFCIALKCAALPCRAKIVGRTNIKV